MRSRFISAEEKQKAQAFLESKQEHMVFVLGAGRSGTQWLCDLLGSVKNAAFYHEPNFRDDVATMDQLRRDPVLAQEYWREFRSVEVYKRWREQPGALHYGEVNGTIRYHAPAIRALYPRAKCFLLARDGRAFVRSVMGFPEFYGARSYGAYALAPLRGDPLESGWSGLSRFEKICWGWRDTYEFLIATNPPHTWLLFERLLSDFDYFQARLTSAIDVPIAPGRWRSGTSKQSRNSTTAHAFPDWEQWSRGQQEAFVRICGETMTKLGYPAL